jgi:hypothetical protein
MHTYIHVYTIHTFASWPSLQIFTYIRAYIQTYIHTVPPPSHHRFSSSSWPSLEIFTYIHTHTYIQYRLHRALALRHRHGPHCKSLHTHIHTYIHTHTHTHTVPPPSRPRSSSSSWPSLQILRGTQATFTMLRPSVCKQRTSLLYSLCGASIEGECPYISLFTCTYISLYACTYSIYS